MDKKIYNEYIKILHSELVPAMGCTEPIAIALTAAHAREHLIGDVVSVEVCVSGNIIKNVKSVMVPNTGGLRGIEAATAAGIVAGNADKELELLSSITEEKQQEIADFLDKVKISVTEAVGEYILDIGITLHSNGHSAVARTVQHHTGLCLIEADGKTVYEKEIEQNAGGIECKRYYRICRNG